ncbi:MAG TPA: alkaline phosphatase family protein [Aliidongia sp.]|uniref:alkaline phosphatase family protein n=1 Tax=Aliidongia sp. TaxID=1914230 RepID=UPI002DDD80CA|nr:alkaline phosphatase family protein [Aliidongia sp.]HEV2678806.1 alkaline phosphatase family protein [Aliidongia sp.]
MRMFRCAVGAALAATGLMGSPAGAASYRHVLLISIDGLHQADLKRFIDANGRSVLAQLAGRGKIYENAQTTRPSDSFPGMLAMVTGGTPSATGIYYDASWDRALSPAGSDCTKIGASADFDEEIDVDAEALDAGGGIDEAKLPRDPKAGCKPVWPHAYLRSNTVFDVVTAAGLTGAWLDKHPAYDILKGRSGTGLADFYAPEIAAGAQDHDVRKAEANDDLRVAALVREINGLDHAGIRKIAVPAVFGMNFQAVSVGQKYAGYIDAAFTPSPDLAEGLAHTDRSLGVVVSALKAAGLYDGTLLILASKHGNSPVDPKLVRKIDGKSLTKAVDEAVKGGLAHATLDDVGLLWLTDGAQSKTIADALMARKDELGIGHIYQGPELKRLWGADPAADSRVPDLFVETQPGVIYTKPTNAKIAEHGGFSADDTHVAILVSGARITPGTVRDPIEIRQVAPTILRALGMDPNRLDAVRAQHTKALPGLDLAK